MTIQINAISKKHMEFLVMNKDMEIEKLESIYWKSLWDLFKKFGEKKSQKSILKYENLIKMLAKKIEFKTKI